jgi:serine/threonine protein phosphatase 1
LWRLKKFRRKSRPPKLPAGVRLYAIGDVHGNCELLEHTFSLIDADLNRATPQYALEILLGDYVDRGPSSRQVLDCIIARSGKRRVVCLKGNHEAFLLNFLKNPQLLDAWRNFGGLETLLSYGLTPKLKTDAVEQAALAHGLAQALAPGHLKFLASLKLSFACGDFFFCHAGVKPGVALKDQQEKDLLWIRDEFLACKHRYEKMIIHGHTPVNEPEFHANRINIDTGAYATGKMTCLVIEGDQMRVL